MCERASETPLSLSLVLSHSLTIHTGFVDAGGGDAGLESALGRVYIYIYIYIYTYIFIIYSLYVFYIFIYILHIFLTYVLYIVYTFLCISCRRRGCWWRRCWSRECSRCGARSCWRCEVRLSLSLSRSLSIYICICIYICIFIYIFICVHMPQMSISTLTRWLRGGRGRAGLGHLSRPCGFEPCLSGATAAPLHHLPPPSASQGPLQLKNNYFTEM